MLLFLLRLVSARVRTLIVSLMRPLLSWFIARKQESASPTDDETTRHVPSTPTPTSPPTLTSPPTSPRESDSDPDQTREPTFGVIRVHSCQPLTDVSLDAIDPLRMTERVAAIRNMSLTEVLKHMDATDTTCVPVMFRTGLIDIVDVADTISAFRSVNITAEQAMHTSTLVDKNVSTTVVFELLKEGKRNIGVNEPGVLTRRIITRQLVLRSLLEADIDLGATVHGCGLAQQELITVQRDALLVDVLRKMVDSRITSVPVLGGTPCVFSMTDIRNLIRMDKWLSATIGAYVDATMRPRPIVTCTRDDALRDVITRMVQEKVHHLYVLRDECPTGVVSFVDVIRSIATREAPVSI